MRTHGVPNFPDPLRFRGHAAFGFTVKSGVDPNTPQFKAALKYCTTRYRIFHSRGTPAQVAQWTAEAVKYSHCVRSHGAPDFPDPDGQGIIPLPTDSYENTPTVQRAEGACQSLRTSHVLFGVPVP